MAAFLAVHLDLKLPPAVKVALALHRYRAGSAAGGNGHGVILVLPQGLALIGCFDRGALRGRGTPNRHVTVVQGFLIDLKVQHSRTGIIALALHRHIGDTCIGIGTVTDHRIIPTGL